MKAAILKKLNSSLEIENLVLHKLDFGQVLVRVLVSGICGSQLHEISGHKNNEKFLPHLMGHEGVGIVESMGAGVTRVRRGDKVVMHWRVGLGIESSNPKYKLNGKDITSGKINSLAELVICSENRLTSIPQDTPNDFAALLGCSITTAFGVIDNEINLKFGEKVLIAGTGGVGLNLIQAVKLKGAGLIVGFDWNERKSALAKAMGVDLFASNFDDLLGEFDVIIDTTGIPDLIGKLFLKLSKNGRMVLVGQPKPNEKLVLPNALTFFNGAGLRIWATQGGSTNPSTDIQRYLLMQSKGIIDFEKLITHRFDLEKINEAFDVLRSGVGGRIMIDIQK